MDAQWYPLATKEMIIRAVAPNANHNTQPKVSTLALLP
jgi:hypothetical protein